MAAEVEGGVFSEFLRWGGIMFGLSRRHQSQGHCGTAVRSAARSNRLKLFESALNRVLLTGATLLLWIALSSYVDAQFVSRSIGRWAVGDAIYRGAGYGRVQYGASGYSYYPNGNQTACGNALRAQADLTMARGRAARQQAQANEYNERARRLYLENKARYLEIRNQQRDVIEEHEAEEQAAQQERASNRQTRRPTELYPRLSVGQLDPTTGKITWPKCLTRDSFQQDRQQIESAVRSMAENGPGQRSAGIIHSTATQMKSDANALMSEIGFEAYSDARKFLGSLSVEGYYALENL